MADWKLNHFADAGKLCFQAADILIGNPFCAFKLGDIVYLKLSLWADDAGIFRLKRGYFELDYRISHEMRFNRQNVP